MSNSHFSNIPHAGDQPFDNSSNSFSSNNVQDAIEEVKSFSQTSIEGSVIKVDFAQDGGTKDKWLQPFPKITSNETPVVIDFDSDLISLTFSNKKTDVDTDLEFYKVTEGNGTTKTLVFTWQIRGTRAAYKSDFSSTISFSQGDRLAVYAAEPSGGANEDPDNVHVGVLLKITDNTEGSGSENYSGNLVI